MLNLWKLLKPPAIGEPWLLVKDFSVSLWQVAACEETQHERNGFSCLCSEGNLISNLAKN